MSQYFSVRGKTVWNPGMSTSRVFRRGLAGFADELGLPTGIGPMEPDDDADVDPEVFGAYAHGLLRWYRQHVYGSDALALADGFTTYALALAQRAGVELDWPVEEQPWPRDQLAALRERVETVAGQMLS